MGNATSGLPFVIGDEVSEYPEYSNEIHWRLHSGTKRSGGDPVSIFRLINKMCPYTAVESARHGFHKLRTLRHPHVLVCLDGAEMESELVMAVEEVVSLGQWARSHSDKDTKDDQVAWGLFCLISALKFLHEDCKLSHNNISTDTIFVNKGGDWKLGGMDLLAPLNSEEPSLQSRGAFQPKAFRSPERGHDDWWRSSGPIHSMDVYSVGRVLQKVYPEGIPKALEKYVDKMLLPDPVKRPTPAQYLRCAFLRRQCVKDLDALGTYSLMDGDAKAQLLKRFTEKKFSRAALHHKVVPVLLRELSLAVTTTGGANGGTTPGATRTAVAMCLPPVLEISKTMDDDTFQAMVEPALAGLFSINDRGVRVMLLSNMPLFANRLQDKVVNDQVFEPLCAGFTDSAAPLRELTLKSMVVFTSRLSEKNMNEKLIKHLARLQGDVEDSIRTNAIIFLGKVAGQLKAAVRERILLPAFARGVKDPFAATRLAGLRATAACHHHFRAEEVCAKVLPSVIPCLIDPGSASVRDAAFACIETYLSKLKDVSVRMSEEEERRRQKEAAERAAELASHGAAASNQDHSNGGNYAGATSSASKERSMSGTTPTSQRKSSEWGSWALGMLTDKLSSSAVPSGPVGDSSVKVTSPTPAGDGRNTSLAAWDGKASVGASIPGSVAAAVAAGLPVGGGIGEGNQWDEKQSGNGACSDANDEENWQDARDSHGAGDIVSSTVIASGSGGSTNEAGEGWDWDGLEEIGDDDAQSSNTSTPLRVAKLGPSAAKGSSLNKGTGDTARRREELQRRRDARRAQRENKSQTPPKPVAKKLLDLTPPDGWEDF